MDQELVKAIRQIIREEAVQLAVGDDYMMTSKQAAQYLKITTNTLSDYRSRGIGPGYVEGHGANGKVLYPLSELKNYCRNRTVKTRDSIKGGTTK